METEKVSYKKVAYVKAISALSVLSSEEFAEKDNFTDLIGIGGSINSKILEYKNNGIIDRIKDLPQVKSRKGFSTIRQPIDEVDLFILLNLSPIISLDKVYICGSLRRKTLLEQEGVEVIYNQPKGDGPYLHAGHH
jgi:DNA polymerase/3'-5' exonuclease PolX